jgi:hypothetical protein
LLVVEAFVDGAGLRVEVFWPVDKRYARVCEVFREVCEQVFREVCEGVSVAEFRGSEGFLGILILSVAFLFVTGVAS